MSDTQADITHLLSTVPLPPPTTVSRKSLLPQASSSRSRSHSLVGTPQLLYPDDYDGQARHSEAQSSSSRDPACTSSASASDGSSGAGGASGRAHRKYVVSEEGSSGAGGKRKRSRSPVASGSRSADRKGKRRAVADSPETTPGVNELERSIDNSDTLSAEDTFHPDCPGPTPDRPKAPSQQQDSSAEDPKDAFRRMMNEHLSASSHPQDATASDSDVLNAQSGEFNGTPSFDAKPTTPPGTSTFPTVARDLAPCPVHPPSSMIPGHAGNNERKPKTKPKRARTPAAAATQEVEPLAAYTCPICFSAPTCATITPCGHVLCGECLFTAVKTTIQRGAFTLPAGERMIARCPVCRAPIPGWDGKGGGVIGLRPRAVFSL